MVSNKKVQIVVPTIRDADFFESFILNWKEEFSGCNLIVIEDRKRKILNPLLKSYSKEFNFTYELYDWRDIDEDLKDDAWIISRRTDCVRNYGYLVAYRNNPLFIVTLDDDLKPGAPGHIQQFYNNLFTKHEQSSNYFSTMQNVLPRGKLDNGSICAISHGGWLNVPDLDAETQIKYNGMFKSDVNDFYRGVIPTGCMYSMCGMNLAWSPEVTKYLYFPLMGAYGGYPIDRCGDIWAGYYSKDKLDKEDLNVYTGEPFCIHTRASNPWTNLAKEEDASLLGDTFIDVMIKGKECWYKDWEGYFIKLKEAYKIWERLINEIDTRDC